MAALRHAWRSGRRRRQLHDLHGAFAVPAELVRAPARSGHQHRVRRRRRGAIVFLPSLQSIIERDGWRAACSAMGLVVLVVIGLLSQLLQRKPEDLGLLADGALRAVPLRAAHTASNVVDSNWAAIDWTLARAVRTGRFWWILLAYFCAMFAWYVVQVHQTKYLIEVGFTPLVAAWSLGFVAVAAIPGQIALGEISDRAGREWVWTIACCGFAVCYAALIASEHAPSPGLLYLMVVAQGFLGYAMTSVMGPIVAEIFEGRHYGAIFGTVTVALIGGGAVGPWAVGVIHDATGSYRLAFVLCIAGCGISAAAVWIAAPRKVRLVPGRVRSAA
jgi:nitrate/nitrite transporter NarK